MKILFLSYWSAYEGLSSATVIPNLRILAGFEAVDEIIFCSIERENQEPVPLLLDPKIKHIPLISDLQASVLITKANDFFKFPKALVSICRTHKIDLILCRTSLAGALGYLVHKRINIPFAVESFEPHADYMVDSGVWKTFDPRLWIQRYFERRIKKTAHTLFPVSNHYQEKLLLEGIRQERIIVQPCCVASDDFAFSPADRTRIRKNHNIPDGATVGIYVGKFGGIYYDSEAFELYAAAFRFFGGSFFLIILSADNSDGVQSYLKQFHIPEDRVVFLKVAHHEVPAYLSAADFAFSTIKPAPSRRYCSPIKDGEYWASGLPILIEPDIGDDSAIIQHEGGGVILDHHHPETAFKILQKTIAPGRALVSQQIVPIAFKHRRIALVKESYEKFLGK
jgi:glycosyltransferase involved in cell wall biosynthesis